MYKCYIIDDEPLAIKVIEQHLSKLNQFEVVGSTTDPMDAFAALKSRSIDLLFLDIQMPEITGLDLIATLQHKPEIIITTAYREYAVESFELAVLDYLVKPIPFTRFLKAIDKFLNRQAPPEVSSKTAHPTSIFVKSERKTVRVNLSEILYIEGLKDYVKIVLADQRILTKTSVGNFFKTLPKDQFLRIHKSFIISKSKITAYTAHDVEIGKLEIPIGRVYKEAFLREMG